MKYIKPQNLTTLSSLTLWIPKKERYSFLKLKNALDLPMTLNFRMTSDWTFVVQKANCYLQWQECQIFWLKMKASCVGQKLRHKKVSRRVVLMRQQATQIGPRIMKRLERNDTTSRSKSYQCSGKALARYVLKSYITLNMVFYQTVR